LIINFKRQEHFMECAGMLAVHVLYVMYDGRAGPSGH
jgi:hypothetical protein